MSIAQSQDLDMCVGQLIYKYIINMLKRYMSFRLSNTEIILDNLVMRMELSG